MAKCVLWTVLFSLAGAILQSTILSRLALFGAVPDLALLVLVYSSYINGGMAGQLCGFFSGFFLDFLSAAPLGLNSLMRTIIGALAGRLRGAFFLDPVLLPMLLCAAATLFKIALVFLLHLLFPTAVSVYSLTMPLPWVELGLNTVLSPLIFAFLKLFSLLSIDKRKS
jgi:rod shape-determining protein MreD